MLSSDEAESCRRTVSTAACGMRLLRKFGTTRKALVQFCWRMTVSAVVATVFPAAYEMHRAQYDTHVIAWFIAGFFAAAAVLLAVHQILQHLIHYRQPALQKFVVRILWMVPVYAVNSWCGLRFKHISLYLDVLRESYEAFVVYSFVKYLMTYLGSGSLESSETHLASRLAVQPVTRHLFPFCFLRTWELPSEFINKAKFGVLQVLTATIPMDDPYCSCKLTRVRSRCSTW